MKSIDIKLFTKTFLVTLGILSFIFGLSYILSMPYVFNKTVTVQQNMRVPKQPTSIILLMVSDDKKSTPTYYNILSINSNKNIVYVASLHKNTAVYLNEENSTLTQAFAYGGALQALQSFEKSYNMDIDNYINMTFDEYGKFLDNFGMVDYDVFSDISIKDDFNRIVFKLNSGLRTLTGYTASNLIKYSPLSYDENLILMSDIMSEYIIQNTQNKGTSIKDTISDSIENIENDITSTNIDKIENSISAMKDDYKIRKIHITGDMQNDVMYLDEKTINELKEMS